MVMEVEVSYFFISFDVVDPVRSRPTSNNSRQPFPFSVEGAAAPYVGDISRYLQVKSDIARMDSAAAYQAYLADLTTRKTKITIPAFFIKVRVLG